MIIEDSGEKEKSRHYVGNVLKRRGNIFKREEMRISGERVGDYIGLHGKEILWMVERKRDKDFVKSTKDGRLDDQLEKMSRLYSGVKFVIFEGDWNQTLKDYYYFYNKLKAQRIKTAFYGVNFVICKDEEATASFLLLLEKHCKKYQVLDNRAHKPTKAKGEDIRLIPLMAIPGIGRKTAALLLDEFKSIDMIIALAVNNPKKLTSLKGIGNKVVVGITELYTSKEVISIDRNTTSGRDGRSMGRNNVKGKGLRGRSSPPYSNNENIYRRRKNN